MSGTSARLGQRDDYARAAWADPANGNKRDLVKHNSGADKWPLRPSDAIFSAIVSDSPVYGPMQCIFQQKRKMRASVMRRSDYDAEMEANCEGVVFA
eukprot:gene19738-26430_t